MLWTEPNLLPLFNDKFLTKLVLSSRNSNMIRIFALVCPYLECLEEALYSMDAN
jgi:hypothetical protein